MRKGKSAGENGYWPTTYVGYDERRFKFWCRMCWLSILPGHGHAKSFSGEVTKEATIRWQ